MMKQRMPFDFADQVVADSSAYVARLPRGLSTKDELLRALYEHLQLPGYFGFNWDALLDCLRDFHWIELRTIVLVHTDLPPLPVEEFCTYIGILADATASWKPEEEHILRVVFPNAAHVRVSAVLAAS